jgi:hypothetical protein
MAPGKATRLFNARVAPKDLSFCPREVAVRSCFVNELSLKYGSHWYLDSNLFGPTYNHRGLIEKIEFELHIDSVSKKPFKGKRHTGAHHYTPSTPSNRRAFFSGPFCWTVGMTRNQEVPKAEATKQ